jgi:hypothetical protein
MRGLSKRTVRVNPKRILLFWAVIMGVFVSASVVHGALKAGSLPAPHEETGPVIEGPFSFESGVNFQNTWSTELSLSENPSLFAFDAFIPFLLEWTSQDASGNLNMRDRLLVNEVLVLDQRTSFQVEPTPGFGAQGDLISLKYTETLTTRFRDALRVGTNSVVFEWALTWAPGGSGSGSVRIGPLNLLVQPVDLAGDLIADATQPIRGVNYYVFSGAVAILSLALLAVSDVLIQRYLDRKATSRSGGSRPRRSSPE